MISCMRSVLVFFVVSFLFAPLWLHAQEQIVEVGCGDVVEAEFVKKTEFITFKIQLEGGDKLKIYAKGKYGNLLKLVVQVFGPAGNTIITGAYVKDANTVNKETPVLSATGTYLVTIHNAKLGGYTGEIGPFIAEFTCVKRDGSSGTSSTSSPSNSPPPQTEPRPPSSTPTINLFTLPPNTKIEGSVKPNSREVQAFKTQLKANARTTISLRVLSGDTPLSITIQHAETQTVIYKSTLQYSEQMDNVIRVPETARYVVMIHEGKLGYPARRATTFELMLKSP